MIWGSEALHEWALKGGIYPFDHKCVNPASIDLSISNEIKRFGAIEIERKNSFMLYPGEGLLASTIEYIKMPSNAAGALYLKSTMGRKGLDHCLAGWIDPGFEGSITLELHAHKVITLYPGERVIQLVLMDVSACEPYCGRYQFQKGVTDYRPEK